MLDEYRIAKLELKPGDLVVMKLERTLSDEQYKRIAANLKSIIPSANKVLILDREADLSVLTRADIEARAS